MTHDEKLEIASMLDDMGVDIIEAGFPIASVGDFEAVKAIASNSRKSVICGLARANFADIDRCWEAVRHAGQPRIHTFIGTSPLHRAIPNLSMDAMAERDPADRDPCPQPLRRRAVVADGCDAHRTRLPLPGGRDRDQGRRHHDQHSRHRGLHLRRGKARP